MKGRTRIIKNREQRELIVERTVPFGRRLAWKGWTDPEHIVRWWGPKDWTAMVYEMDVRPGGCWRYSLAADDGMGEQAFCKATYNEVIEPSRLVYTDAFADSSWNVVEGSEMLTTIAFEEEQKGTKLSIITRFSSVEKLESAEVMGMIEGFSDAFDRLELYLESLNGGYMNMVISKDGTKIAYYKQGQGPAIILVAPAAADHKDAVQLAEQLAGHFTVYNYDRRGRGSSTDTLPYAIEREIEDIEALIQECGGSASLFGSSAGAVLALDAASRLGDIVTKLFLYEPPFITSNGRSPVPDDYVQQLNKLVETGKRSEAVEYFMTAAIGVPTEFLEFMKADPSWQSMEGMAHTLAYDGQIMSGTQHGQPLPADRWQVKLPTMVMVGENSEPFFHEAAQALSKLLPYGESGVLSGQDHSAVMMAPEELAKSIISFYQIPV